MTFFMPSPFIAFRIDHHYYHNLPENESRKANFPEGRDVSTQMGRLLSGHFPLFRSNRYLHFAMTETRIPGYHSTTIRTPAPNPDTRRTAAIHEFPACRIERHAGFDQTC